MVMSLVRLEPHLDLLENRRSKPFGEICFAERFERPFTAGLSAARTAFLYRRTWHGRIGTKHAAITWLGLQYNIATTALIEPLTCIGWHRFI